MKRASQSSQPTPASVTSTAGQEPPLPQSCSPKRAARKDLGMKTQKRLRSVSMLLCILPLILGACSSNVTRYPASTLNGYRLSNSSKVANVSIFLSSDAKAELQDNLKFDQEELRKYVERALSSYGALDSTKRGQLPTIEILVTRIRIRSSFSAIIWGVMAGADSVTGDIIIKDVTGKEIDHFKVAASYALGGYSGGQDSTRLNWLYEAFAKEMLKEMTKS